MRLTSFMAALGVFAALLLPPMSQAGDGHDHGDAAPVATGRP